MLFRSVDRAAHGVIGFGRRQYAFGAREQHAGVETFQLASTASPTVTNTQWRYSVNGYVKEYDPPSVLSANSSFVLVTTTS